MTIEQMTEYLTRLSNQRFQTKLLNVILTCFSEIDATKKMVIELQEKVNQIIGEWNKKEDQENAEALNNDIEEYNALMNSVNEDTGAAQEE